MKIARQLIGWIAAQPDDLGSVDARYVILQNDEPKEAPPDGLVWKAVTLRVYQKQGGEK